MRDDKIQKKIKKYTFQFQRVNVNERIKNK